MINELMLFLVPSSKFGFPVIICEKNKLIPPKKKQNKNNNHHPPPPTVESLKKERKNKKSVLILKFSVGFEQTTVSCHYHAAEYVGLSFGHWPSPLRRGGGGTTLKALLRHLLLHLKSIQEDRYCCFRGC